METILSLGNFIFLIKWTTETIFPRAKAEIYQEWYDVAYKADRTADETALLEKLNNQQFEVTQRPHTISMVRTTPMDATNPTTNISYMHWAAINEHIEELKGKKSTLTGKDIYPNMYD